MKLVLLILLFLVVSVVIGFILLTISIGDQRNCDWAIIDNVEIHAMINIPKISSSDCQYIEETKTKRTYFELNKEVLSISDYLKENNLIKMDSTVAIDTGTFLNLDITTLDKSFLYFRKNTSEKGRSYILCDKSSHKLWVTIEFESIQ